MSTRIADPATPSRTEREVCLVAPAHVAAKLGEARAMRALTLAGDRTVALETIYWDTPDLAFREHGIALRIRRTDDGAPVLGLKASAGALVREEIEVPIEVSRPRLATLVA